MQEPDYRNRPARPTRHWTIRHQYIKLIFVKWWIEAHLRFISQLRLGYQMPKRPSRVPRYLSLL